MSDTIEERKLKQSLVACITVLQKTINQLRSSGELSQDDSLTNPALEVNIHAFTLNAAEEETMSDFKIELEHVVSEQLPSLSKNCRKYFLDLLGQFNYDYEKQEFTSPFNIGILNSVLRDLQSQLASINAFQAAWNGEQKLVEEYIKDYPAMKDKSGLWGTTLLYSAARNNHLRLVKYLVTKAKCSVNAQNQQHIKRALSETIITDTDYEVNPTAGSTALHGACYYGYLDIVKYLIEQKADYFLINHAAETPIMNAQDHPHIIQYFHEFLIFGYSFTTTDLPKTPILEENQPQIVDCVWEYKPMADQKWYSFSDLESSTLQESLIVQPDKEFKREIHLKVRQGIYSVSLMKFLRSGKDLHATQNLAWVRCRGSSILNFDCYALWQIMFVTYKDAASDSTLEMSGIPTIYNSRFKIHLNSWYYMDARTNNQLDETMKYRKRCITSDLPFINTNQLTFDLQTFSFSSSDGTAHGFIRWIPKMISNNPGHRDKIIGIDQYATLTNMNPIPLTIARMKNVSQITDNSLAIEEELAGNIDDDDSFDTVSQISDEAAIDTSDKTPQTPINHSLTLKNIFNNQTSTTDTKTKSKNSSYEDLEYNTSSLLDTTDSDIDDGTERSIDEFIKEPSVNARPLQQTTVVEQSHSSTNNEILTTMNNKLSGLKEKNDTLENNLSSERAKVQSLIDSGTEQATQHEQQLSNLMACIDGMEKEQEKNKKQREYLNQITKIIKTIEYRNIQREIMHEFFTPKFSLLLDYLRDTTQLPDTSFTDKIPKITFYEQNNLYIITVVGLQGHHDHFNALLQRIWSLFSIIQSAKDYYQRHLNRTLKSMIKETLGPVKSQTQIWREYRQDFIRLLKDKMAEYKKKFDEYIAEKLRFLIDSCIVGKLTQPWIEIRKETNTFLQNYPIINEIESIKQNALEQFIEKNISLQYLKFEQNPTPKSVSVVENFISNIQKEFKTNKIYHGHELKHFNLIPKLLQRLMLYYSSFKLQLPLFESAQELLDIIDKNAVTTISTSTGSGKSTLLPALLVAEGYDKVIVTQPRRLPCQLICQRVNTTMTIDVGSSSEKLAGWAVSGAERNPQAKVLYLTDGLLKERLLYDANFITTHTQLDKSVVFFIDEVHERSVNIDLCLALLARLLTIKPELKSKMKVIISSATLDASVPTLFRQIPQAGLGEFQMPQMGTLHPVTKIHRPNENVLDIVQELCKKRKRHDQILCFVSSVAEVNQGCRLINEISRGTIVAYPLVQSQHPNVQQTNIEHGTVFFSTTVAETSLTFPCLKYVIDTGLINTPVYDIELKRTVLKEVRAAESTIKQRLGRLGRTQPGEYYSLYKFKVDDLRYPIPQICQSDLMHIEFSLRKSPLQKGLNYMKTFLPDKPSQKSIDTTLQQLRQLGIVEAGSNDQLTKHGTELAKLPDFGSLAMSRAILAGICDYNCGRDLISLSSILGVLNTTVIFKSIPQSLKSPDGDFMTLLNVMNGVLLVKQSIPTKQFDIDLICQRTGLTSVQHIVKQALRRYTTLEKFFNLSSKYRERAQVTSGNWEFIAKALLTGYYDNVFISKRDLQDRHLHFERYNGQKGDTAILDLQSTLTRPITTAPVSLVLARDIRYSTAVRQLAILSFVGEIKADWIEYQIERQVDVSNEEETYLNGGNRYKSAESTFSHRINMHLGGHKISLKGRSGAVLDAELHLRQQMISELKFSLKALATSTSGPNFERNLESVIKMTRIFNPLKWRWEAQKQLQITIDSNTATKTCDITVKGRDSENKKVREEFASFMEWLQHCAVFRHPNAGVSPRVLRPQMRRTCHDIEERIAHVADSKRTPIDLYNGTKGTNATRETRMEVVAWIAVCKFDCKVEGGFVRDWVVGHYTTRPANLLTNPKIWIEYKSAIPGLNKEVVPCDIDCHLPSHAYFDIDKFQDELYKYDITCSVYRDNWRYVLLLDENETTGPFTMDLIEPHVALTHDRIDFDVNNLSLGKDYTHELGMRIDVTENPYSIQLEAIVDNIKNKRFQVLRPVDKFLEERMHKMTTVRGWTEKLPRISVKPKPHWQYHAILVPLPRSAVLYKEVCDKMNTIPNVQIISIEEIRNPFLEEIYEGMKKLIKKQCPGANPNERELFHGTNGDGINGIMEDGFDDRYFNASGMYGHGAYFADNPQKSHGYTAADSVNGTRVMYYNKVLLGVPHNLTGADNALVSAPIGYHSVIGKHSALTEYIVYRYGQALPYLKITYVA